MDVDIDGPGLGLTTTGEDGARGTTEHEVVARRKHAPTPKSKSPNSGAAAAVRSRTRERPSADAEIQAGDLHHRPQES